MSQNCDKRNEKTEKMKNTEPETPRECVRISHLLAGDKKY